MRLLKSSQVKEMLSALHVLSAQGLLQAGWKVAVPWPVHSRLRSSSTRAALDGAPVVIVAVSPRKFGFSKFDKIRESRVEVNVNVCVNVKGCPGRLGCSLGYGYWAFGVPSGYISGDLLLRFRGPSANEGDSRIYIVVDAHPD